MNQIVLVGLSYRTSPIEVREKFAFTAESLVLGLNSLGKREFVEECLIISTCNRVEIYASTENVEQCLDENLKGRKKKALVAEKIIQKVEQNFSKWLGSLKVVPTIIGIRKHLEEIKNLELSKAIGKLESLSEEDKRVIEQLASGIIGKVLHKPITILKNESLKADSMNFINAVNMVFGLSEEFRVLDENDEADIEDWYKG